MIVFCGTALDALKFSYCCVELLRKLCSAGAMARILILFVVIALSACSYDQQAGAQPEASAGVLSGRADVVDGDTLDVAGTRIRLFGIDAPEVSQTCRRGDGSAWSCGQWSRSELVRLLGGRPVECQPRDVDRYDRIVAICYVQGRDVNAAMVESGAAHAYRKYTMDYASSEAMAVHAGRGIWQGRHTAPSEYRRNASRPGPQVALSDCQIKGNISEAGKIYHAPGQRDYTRTRVSAGRGERWFCTEAEARAAGWRPARR